MIDPAEAVDLFRSEPHDHLDVGEGQVAYRRVGQGPDVVFVHGWPASGATYRHLLPFLAPHVTCHLLDLPGAGDSRYGPETKLSIHNHIVSVKRVIDRLGLKRYRAVGHDSGGMIARHAVAGDDRLEALGLINTEMPHGMGWRFRSFLMPRNLPGFGAMLGWVAGQPRIRRNKFLLGDAFADASLLDGEFDEFFLRPLHEDAGKLNAAIRLIRSFDMGLVHGLSEAHRQIEAPVQLVWGEADPFFPVAAAREMVGEFADARLEVIEGAGLFAHEERPEAVAEALLPVLAA